MGDYVGWGFDHTVRYPRRMDKGCAKVKLLTPAVEKQLAQNVVSGLIVVAIASASFFIWHHYIRKDGKA